MKRVVFALIAALFVFSCGEEPLPEPGPDNPTPTPTPSGQTWSVNGSVQKGPFTQGTSITIQALDEKLDPTGKNYSTKTTDDAGLFAIGSQIESRYVEIIATGYYFNEIEGKVSSSTLTLRSLSDLSEEGKTNVNLLTTLESDRMMALVKGGKSVAEARKQAEQEIFAVFNIPNTVGDTGFDKMDITGGTDADAILLAISASLQAGRTVGELSELISKIAGEVATSGKLETERIRTQILDGCKKVDADKVRNNLTKRYTDLGKTDFVIPPFEDYLDVNGNGVIDKKDSWIILGQDEFVVSDQGGTFMLELQHNVDFEVSVGDCDWLTWQQTKAYLEDARLVFTAQPSEETDERYAVITIKDKATAHEERATVTQKQKDALTVSASTFELEKEGGTFDITIGYNAEVNVNYADAPWLSIIETKAMQSKTLTFRAQASPEVGTRVGHIVFSIGEGGGSGSQDGFTQSSAWSVIGTIGGDSWTRDIAMSSNGTWHAAFGVSITASDEFKFRQNRDWGTNFGAASSLITTEPVGEEFALWQGGANMKVPAGTYDLYLNPGSAIAIILPAGSTFSRAARRTSNGGLSETVTVYQKGGRTLVLSGKEFTVGPGGGTVSVQATTNVDYEVIGPNVSWITLAEGAGTKAVVTDNYTWTVSANDTGEERTATIVFKDKESDLSETVTITQLQNDIVEGEDAYTIPWEGGQFDVAVQTNAELTASIVQEGEWLSILETKALHSSTITLKAMMNPDLSPRTAYLELTSGYNKWQITITQKANAQQVTVHVATPGTLSEVISEEDLHKIINLKITGKLNEADLELLAGGSYHAGNVINPQPWISCDWLVEELDLSEMTTTTDATGDIFQCVPTLTKVVMPLHVERVSSNAFYLCQNLVTVDFGTNSDILILEGIVDAGVNMQITGRAGYYGAFQSCISLETVTLPDNLEEFQGGAFMNCSSLREIIFPESCNVRTLKPSVGSYTNYLGMSVPVSMGLFWGCTSLDTVILPKSLRRIEQDALSGAQFRKVVFPEGITSIDPAYLFEGCSRLEEVCLPAIITEYADFMFMGCKSLKKIETASPITRYGYSCFKGANSAMINLDPNIKYGEDVFANMDIESLEFPEGFKVIPDGMFAGCTNLKELNLDGIEVIGNRAFNNNALTKLVLPESVTQVGEDAFSWSPLESIDIRCIKAVFYAPFGSQQPVHVTIANTVVSATGALFYWSNEIEHELVFEEGSRCEEFGLAGYSGITSISLPPSVKRLADRAFSNTKIKSIVLPENLEYIGEGAFGSCGELRKITIPAKVETLASAAFSGCEKLYEVLLAENSSLRYIGSGAFSGCRNLEIDGKLFSTVTSIGGSAFSDVALAAGEEIAFPCLTSLGAGAFSGVQGTLKASFPALETIGNEAFQGVTLDIEGGFPKVTSIGSNAFSGATIVSEVDFPSLTTLGAGAFSGVQGTLKASFPVLESIPGYEYVFQNTTLDIKGGFPKVTSIGSYAFWGATIVSEVDFPSLTTLGEYAFRDLQGTLKASFPVLETIPWNAFWGCTALETLDLPAVKDVGAGAFYNSSLRKITLGPELTSIGYDLFYNADKVLEEIHFQGTAVPTTSGDWLVTDGYCPLLKIYVPASAYSAFQTAWGDKDWWSRVVTE